MIIESLNRWQFRRGFRAGYADAKAKKSRELTPGSWFQSGHRLGVAAYALGFEPEDAMRRSEAGAFSRAE
jgi:hypothetical protein